MANTVSIVVGVVGFVGVGTMVILMRDVSGFFFQSPFAMAAVCLLFFALGYGAHALVRLFLNSRANEEKAAIKRLHQLLKERGVGEYYDISCVTTLEALAERMAERAGDAADGRGTDGAEGSPGKAGPGREGGSAPGVQRLPGMASLADDDPLSTLLPVEVPFVLRVYDGACAHVGAENLKVAESLHRKGVVFRMDAPESGVISQCDVALTDKWVRIVRAREGELRAAAS